MTRVLVVEDEESYSDALTYLLRKEGYDVAVAKIPMSYVARALEVDESRGLIKAVVDRKSDQILGAAVLGIEGGELMAVIQMAMMGGVPASRVREAFATFSRTSLACAFS